MSESKSTFLKQGGWMVAATLTGGVGMAWVHSKVGERPEVYAQFKSLLAILYVVGAAQGGLWNLFAQKSAAALTPADRSEVFASVRRTILWILGTMGIVGFALAMLGGGLASLLKLPSTLALWATWGLILATLLAALIRGLLQGGQDFAGLGMVSILDGLGRCLAVKVIMDWLDGGAAGAVTGALLGNLAAIGIGLWALRSWGSVPTRGIRGAIPAGFWPLSLSAAALQALGQMDNVFLQSAVPPGWVGSLGQRYSPGAQIGFALTQFTVPLALVMFPKIVKGAAQGSGSDALRITMVSTLVLGGLAAVGCTVIPWLPVKILYGSIPTELSAPLVPWFAWAMLAYTLANVLLSDRIAHSDFRFVPWLVVLALGYGLGLFALKDRILAGAPEEGFRSVVQVLLAANLTLLALATVFSRLGRARPTAPTSPSAPPAAAR